MKRPFNDAEFRKRDLFHRKVGKRNFVGLRDKESGRMEEAAVVIVGGEIELFPERSSTHRRLLQILDD